MRQFARTLIIGSIIIAGNWWIFLDTWMTCVLLSGSGLNSAVFLEKEICDRVVGHFARLLAKARTRTHSKLRKVFRRFREGTLPPVLSLSLSL